MQNSIVETKRPKTGGRKKGTPNKANAVRQQTVADGGITPLDYLLSIMRDETNELPVRTDAAKAAAPYVHPRLAAIDHSGSLTVSHEAALAELDDDDQ